MSLLIIERTDRMLDYKHEIGRIYGQYKIILLTEVRTFPCGRSLPYFQCACTKCGAKRITNLSTIKKGATCKCSRPKYKKYIDFTNQTFGALTVIGLDGEYVGIKSRWFVKCSICGGTKSISSHNLTHNPNKHCGCMNDKQLDKGRDCVKAFCVEGTNVIAITSTRKLNQNNTTGVRGVNTYTNRNGQQKYRAIIVFKRKQYHLGVFDTIEDAAKARKQAEEQIYGEFLKWYQENQLNKIRDGDNTGI